uniref:Uncharacterized protein n=1 Tax=Setaria digitata TaxID=48799 RepID=A0A915Q1K8_9BILA
MMSLLAIIRYHYSCIAVIGGHFQGTLVGKNTGCISFRGYVDSDSKQKQTAISISVDVIDVESDQNFRINDVRMELDVDPKTSRRNMTLEHPSLKFITQRWHYGCRADVEIHKHINPQMAGCGWELFIGQMTIIMINTYQFAPLTRRLSLTNGDVIESSNDFLA